MKVQDSRRFCSQSTNTDMVMILEITFNTYDIPLIIVLDNGPRFGTREIEKYFDELGIEHQNLTLYKLQTLNNNSLLSTNIKE